MEVIKEANLKDTVFWSSLAAVFGVLTIGVIVAAILLMVTTTTGGVGGMPVFLAILIGFGMGTVAGGLTFGIPTGVFGIFAYNSATATSKIESKINKYLEDTKSVMQQLKGAAEDSSNT